MERISGLDFDYREADIYDIKRESFGSFDIVVFFGLLYHLPDMMKGLAIVRSVCAGQMFIESHCAVNLSPEVAAARYYREDTLIRISQIFGHPISVASATCSTMLLSI